MQNDARIKAKRFLTEYNLKSVTLESVKGILKMQGYTIVEFNNVLNDENVTALIGALGIEKTIAQARGFTYVDQHRRLVFLNEDLSSEEKLVVLVHEEGHIYCNHFTGAPIIGRDVAEEYEANEFSHYVLNPTIWQRWKGTVKRHKKVFAISVVLCLIIAAVALICGATQKEQSYYGDFYLTATGNKYHEKECIFVKDKTTVRRMTIEEFESGEYEPCGICLPGEPEIIPE